MAWYHATPKNKKQSRAESLNGEKMDLPEIEHGAHLIGYLFELGAGADGKPSGWPELRAWQEATGTELHEFEAVTLIEMCREYLGQFSKPDTPQPYKTEIPDPVELGEKIKQAFRSFNPSGHRKIRHSN